MLNMGNSNGNLELDKNANFIVVKHNIKDGDDAESILANVISSCSERNDFSTLIDQTYYLGASIHKKNS